MRLAELYKLILCAIFGHKEEAALLVGKKIHKREPYQHYVALQYLTQIEINRCIRCSHTQIIDTFVDEDG